MTSMYVCNNNHPLVFTTSVSSTTLTLSVRKEPASPYTYQMVDPWDWVMNEIDIESCVIEVHDAGAYKTEVYTEGEDYPWRRDEASSPPRSFRTVSQLVAVGQVASLAVSITSSDGTTVTDPVQQVIIIKRKDD